MADSTEEEDRQDSRAQESVEDLVGQLSLRRSEPLDDREVEEVVVVFVVTR